MNSIGGLPSAPSPTHSDVLSMAREFSEEWSMISPIHFPAGHQEKSEDISIPQNLVTASPPLYIGGLPSAPSPTHSDVLSMAREFSEEWSMISPIHSPTSYQKKPEDIPMHPHNQVTAPPPLYIGGLPSASSPTHSDVLSMAREFSEEWSMISPIHSPAGHQKKPEDIPMHPHNQVTASPPHYIGGLPSAPLPTHSEVLSMAREFSEEWSMISPIHSPTSYQKKPEDIPMHPHNQVTASPPHYIGGLPSAPSPTHSEVLSMAREFSEEWSMISPIHSPADHQKKLEDIPMHPHNQVTASPPLYIGGLPSAPSPTHSEVLSMAREFSEEWSMISPIHSPAGHQQKPEDISTPQNLVTASPPHYIGGLPSAPLPTHSEVLSMAREYSEEWSMISPIHSPAGHQEKPEDIFTPPHNQVTASPPHYIGGLPSPTHSEVLSKAREFSEGLIMISHPIHIRIRSVSEINNLSKEELY
ncbi:uncharacterized protein LOC128991294 [Macrosteles quadrilineatus]|uniref:uncharacterized protein LOC128991294 n=1 Tax=Macrosteles quadrilineatus TaxID=74068 RepID=UPI0023E29DBA|nr:uncharacterized protein LOC128991294 [Macrosteles quadrilineatus]XP_054270056.1 uncharacterized protein LOC128991294 [Macrosteles quadrilineatus]